MAVLFPGTEYLYSDFKKRDGQLKGIRLSRSTTFIGRTIAAVFGPFRKGKPI